MITVRLAQTKDAQQMGEMLVATWLAAHKDHMPQQLWEKRRQEWTPAVSAQGWQNALEEMVAEDDNRSCIFLATTEGNDVIGLCAAFAEADQPLANVVSLYIKQSEQHKGIGRLLLQTTFKHLRQASIETVHIGVLTANTQARRFYERMGGKVAAERTFNEEGTSLPETVYEWTF